ncbi:hypothetical protein [Brucella intermedia]|uniref:Uncharacterized protein n=1 Tax=Brucella intermedia M86 TaxID=1234597 RepID=M5JUG5_9HYPH|nr:hypothetical protein [Brucella intermedia]ELT47061.1 hypothetical protein D584_21641 [Brucella intermedia M86]
MGDGTGYFRTERPGVMKKVYRKIILMPRNGRENIAIREATILLPRVSILESEGGFGEDNGPPPLFPKEREK